ncbi:TPA: hypothetical protein MJQ33_004663 [Salmonella enterica subsp. enterica serovar Enteritidis]|nr:hypothetical protein [Salmonella enterica subsp. enterica serovar Enteritidis]
MITIEMKQQAIEFVNLGVGKHRFECPYSILSNVIQPGTMITGLQVEEFDGDVVVWERRFSRLNYHRVGDSFTEIFRHLFSGTGWKVTSAFYGGNVVTLLDRGDARYLVNFTFARRYAYFPNPRTCTLSNPGILLTDKEADVLLAELRKDGCDVDDWETLVGIAKAHGWYTVHEIGRQLLFLAYNV